QPAAARVLGRPGVRHRARIRRSRTERADLRRVADVLRREAETDRDRVARLAGRVRAVGENIRRLTNLLRDAVECRAAERLRDAARDHLETADELLGRDDACDGALHAVVAI